MGITYARGITTGRRGEKRNETNLTFKYDRIGDILSIEIRPPYQGQDSDEIDDSVVARFHPQTDVVESIEILFLSRHILSDDPFRLNVPVAPGAINGWPAAPEFNCLIQPGSNWLTVPPVAVIGMELDTRPPRFPTYPGNRPADISRFEMAIDSTLSLTR